MTQDDRNTLAELLIAAIAEASDSDAAIDGLDKRAEIAAERIIKYLTESLTGKINVHALIQELSAKDVPVRREDKHIRRIFFAHGITLPGEENNGIGGDGYLIKTPTGSLNENFFQYYGQEDLSQLIVFEGETK